MDAEARSKRMQMFILETSWRLFCGQPCGARPYMKGNVGFECRGTNRTVAHKLSVCGWKGEVNAHCESLTHAGSEVQR